MRKCVAQKLFCGHYINILSVGKDDDSTVLVGAVGGNISIGQMIDGGGVGVAVVVVFAAADEGVFGVCGIKETVGGGGVGAVVANLQHVAGNVLFGEFI